MKIVQIASFLVCGDGVTNCALALANLLKEAGYLNSMAANYVDDRLPFEEIVQFDYVEEICLDRDDVIIYHFSIGTDLNRNIEKLSYKKILVYHNVTPARYFRGVDNELMLRCLWGSLDAENTVGNYLKCITMSEFSKKDLVQYGWNEKDIEVVPLIAGCLKDSHIKYDRKVLENDLEGIRNFLFVGRIVPHKKIEDIIKVFAYYQKHIYSNCRLFLVGSISYKNYFNALKKYIEELGVKDVILTGHVLNEELEAYYAVSDIFLCMSEHEGFCMPLIEAMGRGIPVLAYAAAAVPETLGEAGILLKNKDVEEVCGYIEHIFLEDEFRKKIVKCEQNHVGQISIDRNREKIFSLLQCVMDISNYTYKNDSDVLKIEPKVPEINQWDQLKCEIKIQNTFPIILYGIGKMGKKLFSELMDGGCSQIIACCDNYFHENTYEGVPVMGHKECTGRYKDAIYIITIQKNHVQIVADLLSSGIDEKHIVFWGGKKGFYM